MNPMPSQTHAQDAEKTTCCIEIIEDSIGEQSAVYIDDHRLTNQKVYGGGSVTKSWTIDILDLLEHPIVASALAATESRVAGEILDSMEKAGCQERYSKCSCTDEHETQNMLIESARSAAAVYLKV